MALGRSNSLSINTGATNSLLRTDGPDPRQDPKAYKQWLRAMDEAPLFADTPPDIDAALPAEAQSLITFTPPPKLNLSLPPTPPQSDSSQDLDMSEEFGSEVSVARMPNGYSNGFFPRLSDISPPEVPRTRTTPSHVSLQQILDSAQAQKTASASTSLASMLTNSSAQQQQPNNASNTSGGLFGNSTQNTQTQPSGGLFGNANQQSQPQQGGGLFGSSITQNANSNVANNAGGLFGSANTTQQGTSAGGLFGGNNMNNQQTKGSNSLFGAGNTGAQQNQGTGGLFSGTNTSTQQTQGAGGIFGGGATNTQPSSNLFASAVAQQNKPAGGLFGGSGNASMIGGAAPSMFSQTAQSSVPNATSGLFSNSSFGAAAMQPARQAPSLLSATQHSQINQSTPFGRLSMGQTASAPTTVGAAKVDYAGLLPTTRFEDCIDSVKAELEAVDKMIQQQESWARQIEAFLPKHEDDLKSLGPDVDFIKSKAEDIEQALAADAQGVDTQRRNAERDARDAQRCQRVVTNLNLPAAWQYSNMGVGAFGGVYSSQQHSQSGMQAVEGEEYDTDLIGNYFVPMAAELLKTMHAYANNLTEIENHMRVIENSTVAQAQQLAQRKAGTADANSATGNDTVRELASTLRGFEESILGVAGVVGECRDGVNQLVLGRLNGVAGGIP